MDESNLSFFIQGDPVKLSFLKVITIWKKICPTGALCVKKGKVEWFILYRPILSHQNSRHTFKTYSANLSFMKRSEITQPILKDGEENCYFGAKTLN